MTRKLILASAGSGKTHRIISDGINQIHQGERILVITYTRNNQKEILDRFAKHGAKNKKQVDVKGLFTFLLEDMIRPYQTCIFQDRIETINFNEKNPHQYKDRDGKPRWIRGRQEKNSNGSFNPFHFLTQDKAKVHTIYASKLASKILVKSRGKPVKRLEKIYSHIYFDEVQDLVGWDYDVLKRIAKSKTLAITCVGDFRQTIYKTSIATKSPSTNEQKLLSFQKMRFELEPMNVNHRSIQCICDFADKLHINESYEKTRSSVEDDKTPKEYQEHIGVFIIRESDAVNYIQKFQPVLLRRSVAAGKQISQTLVEKINFGEAKGSGYARVLVLPTISYRDFLMGDATAFDKKKTNESKNKFYVAITRAKYSLAFIIEDKYVDKCSLPIWDGDS